MDARMAASFIPLALSVILALLSVSDEVSSEPRIYAFDPYGEAIAVSNPGSVAVDLNGSYLTDGEGTWNFTEPFKIPAGGVAGFSLKPDCGSFGGRIGIVTVGEKGVTKGKGSLTLGNTGDDIYLMKGGKVIDAVCYGGKRIDDGSVWSGPPMDIRKGYYCVRTGGDTDTADDWILRRPGVTEIGFEPGRRYAADVLPFLFPDSGGVPVYRALESAESSVMVSMYLLSSRNVYALLCDLEDRGVEVTLLLEAAPLGIDMVPFVPLMKSLEDHGGEVFLIGGADEDRFPYMHAKYAIIDRCKVVLTTENWTKDNLNGEVRPCSYGDDIGNRGWGAVVESSGFAKFMEGVFRNDSSMAYGDVKRFSAEYPNARSAGSLRYVPPTGSCGSLHHADVVPFLSPDGSFDAESYYMGLSRERLYSEQQSIGASYRDADEGTPLWCMVQAVARGVDTRLVLEASSAGSYAYSLCASTGIKAASMPSPYVHNKGLVCDDVAIVASVNWTDNSFSSNREVGIAIESGEVSDFFAEAFMKDHRRYYLYEGFDVEISELSPVYRAGEEAVVSVDVTVAGEYSYSWDLGDGRVRSTAIPRMSFWTTEGEHRMTVTVTDGDGYSRTASMGYEVFSAPGIADATGIPAEALLSAAAAVAGALALLVVHLRRRSGERARREKCLISFDHGVPMNVKEAVSLFVVVLLALIAFQAASDDSDAEGQLDGVLISEFSPYDWEGVTLKNYGSRSVDLKGYYLSDGEGRCTFTSSFKLSAGGSVTVVRPDSTPMTSFADRDNVIRIGQVGVAADDKYVFSNKGDDVYLYDPSGRCIDALCFGSGSISNPEHWSGYSVAINGNNAVVVRIGSYDSDSADDWIVSKPGWTNRAFDPSLSYSATVTPFVFPDCGGVPIFDAVAGAKKSVHIEIYQLTNSNMYALLCNLAKKGVDIVVLMEASPNDGSQSDMASRMKALVEAGGEVKLIGGESGERFSFVHAKYAIVDGARTIVTSENWTADNLNGAIHDGTYSGDYGNRGWGVVIDSKEYASYMESIFQNDIDDRYGDVRDFSEMSYAGTRAATLTYRPVSSGSFPSYSANVCPMLSPDNAWDTEMYWIYSADKRVYVQ
ncbi:MAG: lamin tail domain-containing protein [Candidatus Methanomethylophilaceae archaeon]|nr:lamin tail domain-containing protein [Candidatus Methanomethylophilaceae archaeon]